jgi:alanyl-tRNA synthetase
MEAWIDIGKDAANPTISTAAGVLNGRNTLMVSASGSFEYNVGDLTKDILKELGGRGGGKHNFARGSYPPATLATDIFVEFEKKLDDLNKGG